MRIYPGLTYDGQQVTPGKTLNLANDDYELVTLDSKEATEKYSDRGYMVLQKYLVHGDHKPGLCTTQ